MKALLFVVTILMSCSLAAAPIRSITVKGEGESEVAPDFVRLSATITAEGKDATRTKQDVDRRMRKAVETIATFDIDSRDITFGAVTVEDAFKYDRNDNEIPTGTVVSRTLEVRLRDLSAYEQLVQALVSAGADQISGAESDVDDKNKLKMSALQRAAENAKTNAGAIAESLGVRLGAPLEVGEDRLWPRIQFEQGRADNPQMIQEIVVAATRRGIENPLLFIPKNIRTKATVWVRYEILTNEN